MSAIRIRPPRRRVPRSVGRAIIALLSSLVALIAAAVPAQAATHTETILFNGGNETLNGVTYHSFRIPSLVRLHDTNNTLLAFAEGRTSSNHDWGNINVVFKRSQDNGVTWTDGNGVEGALGQVVGSTLGTWGNPTAVVSADNTVYLFLEYNPAGTCEKCNTGTENTDYTNITEWDQRQVYLTKSSDLGTTWSTPVNMSDPVNGSDALKPRLKDPSDSTSTWAFDVVGPGVGTTLSDGTLVVPAMHRNFYSTDQGTTWHDSLIENQSTGKLQKGTGEGTVLAVTDGTTAGAGTYNTLYRNDREYVTSPVHKRMVTRGTISGGYGVFAQDSTLNDPGNEGSILRYNTSSPPRILFMNSNSPTAADSTLTRQKMLVRVSCDEGKTWKYSRYLSDSPLPVTGEGGYSSMAKTADGFAGALVEVNEDTGNSDTSHRSIAFRKFNVTWILDGETDCS